MTATQATFTALPIAPAVDVSFAHDAVPAFYVPPADLTRWDASMYARDMRNLFADENCGCGEPTTEDETP